MKIKITTVCENSVFRHYGAVAEHGLCFFLETECGNYLMDTGQGKAIINNSLVLDLDLRSIKGIIMSHHHVDHTGGLVPVLNLKEDVNIYAHPDFFKESYNIGGKRVRYTGVPYTRSFIESKGANLKFNRNFREIEPGFWLTGEVPRYTNYETGDKNQVVKSKNGYMKDKLLDDQSVAIETEKGLLIILGCCHSGIINTLNYIIEKTGRSNIYAVIGGTHLEPVSDEQREKSINDLKKFDIKFIGVSHCTGLKAASRLVVEFGNRFFFCNVGNVVEV
jgi:7,8-dihydropterin-6-yl-methyl-4-(beta-D-ribofuranosyl)aminobenzene 5'-phosphate synthase